MAPPEPHGLDALPVIEGFARHGIVCAVLHRQPDDTLVDPEGRLSRLIQFADILVIDWHIHAGPGPESVTQTLDLLESIFKHDENENQQQLRLIAVYTGERNLGSVMQQIRQRIELTAGAIIPEGDFALCKGGIKVVVLGKIITSGRAGPDTTQEVSFEHLGDRAISEFATMTAGLVSNVAMASLTEIRRTTHRLLSRFTPDLDAPFLAHRALLNPPSNANDQLVPLIMSELEAILEDLGSRDLLSDDTITEWLAGRPDPTQVLQTQELNTTDKASQAIKDICLKGVGEHANFTVPSKPSWTKKMADNEGFTFFKRLTDCINGIEVANANEQFEERMSLRSHYGDKPPKLALGTLLSLTIPAAETSPAITTYWVCIQPACDCYIRDKDTKKRHFPFLRLEQAKENGPFNLLARFNGNWLRLKCTARPLHLQMFQFEANSPDGAVIAVKRENQYWIDGMENTSKFSWIGQLKFPQAQRMAHALGSETARVGLTESEWLRRTARSS